AAKRSARAGGTTFRYELSEPARVRIRVERRLVGHKVGSRCRRVSGPIPRRKRCKRYARLGTIRARGVAGKNRTHFSGWLGHRPLKPGRYRARLTATDVAKNHPRPRTVSFRIR